MRGLSQLTGLRRAFGAAADPATAALLDRTEIADLLRRAQSVAQGPEYSREVAHSNIGSTRSVYRGFGLDYEESRPYQPGDELRFMNWRLTARTGEPHMKVFREERRPGVFIVIDRRASMRFGTRRRLKVAQAARVAALVAFAAQAQHSPIGGVTVEPEPQWLTESAGPQSAFAVVGAANRPCPVLPTATDEPTLEHILRLTHAVARRGTAVYVISDFHDLEDSARHILLQLATEHQLCAVHIVDAAEEELPAAGPLQLDGAGGETGILTDTSDPATRRAYAAAARHQLDAVEALFTSLGIHCTRITADRDDIERDISVQLG
jgi:uncharacterized protein (DUF58 family)